MNVPLPTMIAFDFERFNLRPLLFAKAAMVLTSQAILARP